MNKGKKIPTTVLLLCSAWIIIAGGLTFAVVQVSMSGGVNEKVFLGVAPLVLGCLICALLIRMFANMGQMLFEMQNSFQEFHKNVCKGLEGIRAECEQINCDAKDINQNIHDIRSFIEHVERHLDLKK